MNRTIQWIRFFTMLAVLEKQFSRLKQVYVRDRGLKGSDVNLLLALYIDPNGLRHDEISREIGADKAQISRSLKSLREHGYVDQQTSGIYKARYRLSPKGKDLAEYLIDEARRIFTQAHITCDSEQWEAFGRLCTTLSQEFEKEIARKTETDRSACPHAIQYAAGKGKSVIESVFAAVGFDPDEDEDI